MNAREEHRAPAAHLIRLGSQWDFERLPAAAPPPVAPPDAPPDAPQVAPPDASAVAPPEAWPGPQRLRQLSDYAQAARGEPGGRVRLSRRFGRPTGLARNQRVELAVDGSPAAITVSLNDQVLAPLPAASATTPTDPPGWVRFNVAELLLQSNRLCIEFDAPARPDVPPAVRDARLEILGGGP